jgi:hypothetical protein
MPRGLHHPEIAWACRGHFPVMQDNGGIASSVFLFACREMHCD